MNKKYYYFIGGGILVVLAVVAYFLFFSRDPELQKVVKSLNAQNYEMAIIKLKDILYNDEENMEAKGLLLYAQTRKHFEENDVTDFKTVMQYTYGNLLALRVLIFQSRFFELGLLGHDEKEDYLKSLKELRKILRQKSVLVEDMKEVEEMLRQASEKGVEYLKLAQGDEVDQALYAILLAGDAFFGNKESGEKLIKLAKMNEEAQILFLLSGINLAESLKKEVMNDESISKEFAKMIIMNEAMRGEIADIFRKYSKMKSAYAQLKERDQRKVESLTNETIGYSDFLFYDNILFEDYIKYRETNKNFGIDVQYLNNGSDLFLATYLHNPTRDQFVTKVFILAGTELKEVKFGNEEKVEFISKDFPSIVQNNVQEKNTLTIAEVRKITKTGYKTESKYNPKKFYSYSGGFQGGYDYVQVPYEYEELETVSTKYKVEGEFASNIDENENKNSMDNSENKAPIGRNEIIGDLSNMWTSERLITYDDIKNMSKWDLRIMRNDIYARHGYIFKSTDLKNYFSSKSWYEPRYSDVTSMLSEIERKNIEFLKKYE